MGTIPKDRMLQFRGEDLHDRDGEKIGGVEEIYLDAETNEPEWALVHTGLFGTKRTFVPLREAEERDGTLTVPIDKDTVKGAPKVEPNGQLTQQEEQDLFAHYGIARDSDESGVHKPGSEERKPDSDEPVAG